MLCASTATYVLSDSLNILSKHSPQLAHHTHQESKKSFFNLLNSHTRFTPDRFVNFSLSLNTNQALKSHACTFFYLKLCA